MNKNISIVSILRAAFADLQQAKLSIFILSSIFLLWTTMFMAVSLVVIYSFMAVGLVVISSQLLAVCLLFILITTIIPMYLLIMQQNFLDIVYKRKLHWISLSPAIVRATFAVFLTTVVSRSGRYSCNLILFPQSLFLMLAILLVYVALSLCLFYFQVRAMFVSLSILEQNTTILQGISYSWKITEKRFWFLVLFSSSAVGLFILPTFFLLLGLLYLDPKFFELLFLHVDTLSIDQISIWVSLLTSLYFVIIWYIIFPLTALMTVHLFKQLVESEENYITL